MEHAPLVWAGGNGNGGVTDRVLRDLRDAYDEGDLARVRRLVERAEAGLFLEPQVSGETEARTKQRLRARIDGIREAIERARAGIDAITQSPSYATMTEHDDWLALFEAQGRQLDQEIENLSMTLEGMLPSPNSRKQKRSTK